MKNYIISILAILTVTSGYAQLDRSKIPGPGSAREIKIGDYESFTLKNGLRVFVVENHKLPSITFSLVLDRDPIFEGENAGYTTMVGRMMRAGTTTKSKQQIDEEVEFIGASLNVSSTSLSASSLSKYNEEILDLMTDVLYNPVFPEEELDKIIKQTLSGLAYAKDDAESISGNISQVLKYGAGHPYGEQMTEQTVEKITVQDIKTYYDTYFRPNISYLAIVGDITKKDAKKLVKKYFNKWETKAVEQEVFTNPDQPENTMVGLSDKPSAVQSVVNITYPIPLISYTDDVLKCRVLSYILGGGASSRLFNNLREDKGFTYGAYSSISSDDFVGSFSAGASVRNEVTDSAITEIIYEMNQIVEKKVTQEEVDLAISAFSGSFARSLERPSTVARFALNTAIYDLPDDYYSNYLKRVQAITPEDVLAMAKKYIKPDNAYITVVGKASEIAASLDKFGEVKYYDIYGNEYNPDDAPKIPEGLTPEKVVDKYLSAVGGKEKILAIKDLKIISTASIQGQSIEIISASKQPDKHYSAVTIAGTMELQKSVYNQGKYVEYRQGNKVPSDEKKTEDAKVSSGEFPELNYNKYGVQQELTIVEKVGEEFCYVIDAIYPSGKKISSYYALESGLKLKQINYAEGPQGEVAQAVEFKEYKSVEGVMFPQKILIPVGGGMVMEAEIKEIMINKGIDDTLFDVD